jgi:hypothetical protein
MAADDHLFYHSMNCRLLFFSTADDVAELACTIGNNWVSQVPYLTIRQTHSTKFYFRRTLNFHHVWRPRVIKSRDAWPRRSTEHPPYEGRNEFVSTMTVSAASVAADAAPIGAAALSLGHEAREGAVPTQLISFAIGDDQYGVDIMAVREIKGWIDITHLPR